MKKFLMLLFVVLLLDMIYISLISKTFKKMIENIQKTRFKLNYTSAALCYIFIVIQLYVFIIQNNESIQKAFLLGFTTYGIYELTNLATITQWNVPIAIMDTIWGGILYALTSYITLLPLKLE